MPAPDRFPAEGAALLVVDMQGTLLRLMRLAPLVIANTERLIRGANALDVPVLATEQYPKGLGPTVESLLPLLPDRRPKTAFHAADAAGLTSAVAPLGVRHVTVAGIEAHVCILQTALELLERGYRVQVPADAVASRGEFDREVALRRLERAGAVVTTTEAALFEWTGRSDHPQFKAISALIKDFRPPSLDG